MVLGSGNNDEQITHLTRPAVDGPGLVLTDSKGAIANAAHGKPRLQKSSQANVSASLTPLLARASSTVQSSPEPTIPSANQCEFALLWIRSKGLAQGNVGVGVSMSLIWKSPVGDTVTPLRVLLRRKLGVGEDEQLRVANTASPAGTPPAPLPPPGPIPFRKPGCSRWHSPGP